MVSSSASPDPEASAAILPHPLEDRFSNIELSGTNNFDLEATDIPAARAEDFKLPDSEEDEAPKADSDSDDGSVLDLQSIISPEALDDFTSIWGSGRRLLAYPEVLCDPESSSVADDEHMSDIEDISEPTYPPDVEEVVAGSGDTVDPEVAQDPDVMQGPETVPEPEHEPEPEPISDISESCYNNFIAVKGAAIGYGKKVNDHSSALLVKELFELYERYGQWAGNLGAMLQPSNPLSLNYRLRRAKLVRAAIFSILVDLEQSLQLACGILDGTRPNKTGTDFLTDLDLLESRELMEEYELDLYDTDSEEGTSIPVSDNLKTAPLQTTELRETVSAIHLGIDSLFRASIFVRQFSSAERRERAMQTKPFDNRADILRIKQIFKEVDDPLAHRLGEANARRRQFFKYRKDHDRRIKEQAEKKVKEEAKPLKPIKEEETFWLQQPSTLPIAPIIPFSKVGSVETADVTLLAETEATAFLPGNENHFVVERVERAETEVSRFSVLTSVVDLNGDAGTFPPIPLEGRSGNSFVCPFCYGIVKGINHKKDEEWRETKWSLDTFHSQQDWFDHELISHRSQWACAKCGGLSRTSDAFKTHIFQCQFQNSEKEFAASFESISAILEQSKRPVREIEAKSCPFCHDDAWTLDDSLNGDIYVSIDDFRKHVGQHMQEVSLFSLPRLLEGDDGTDSADLSGAIADLDHFSEPDFSWGRVDCGRGWRIVSKCRPTFFAVLCFTKLLREMRGKLFEEASEYSSTYPTTQSNNLIAGPEQKTSGSRTDADSDTRPFDATGTKLGASVEDGDENEQEEEEGSESGRTDDEDGDQPSWSRSRQQPPPPPTGLSQTRPEPAARVPFKYRDRSFGSINYVPPTDTEGSYRVTALMQGLREDNHLRTLHNYVSVFLCGTATANTSAIRTSRYSMFLIKLDSETEEAISVKSINGLSPRIQQAKRALDLFRSNGVLNTGLRNSDSSFYLPLRSSETGNVLHENELHIEEDVVAVMLYDTQIQDHRIRNAVDLQWPVYDGPDPDKLAPRYFSDMFWSCCLGMTGITVSSIRDDYFTDAFNRLINWKWIKRPDKDFWWERVENLTFLFHELYTALDDWSTIRRQIDERLKECAVQHRYDDARTIILNYLVDTGPNGKYQEHLQRIIFYVGCILLLRDGRPPSVDERLRRYL
ncbi:hypothetical protein BJ508DRAFT_304371 [Ascobolus immersus RN42]|uniref:Uncharacterized protein n=1 Tax=Ascobolus immersus RN42 TaxID=1160509 RepID=A0A3N4IEG3_ASCIM|nr:hypothetical protein BJ508DRAFT_304371 [Ascobolus immersus RN42]